jgi:hypothetical protein
MKCSSREMISGTLAKKSGMLFSMKALKLHPVSLLEVLGSE